MALTATPAAGAKLRGSVLSALMTERTPLYAEVGSNQLLTVSSTTLQNVTDLVVALAASARYDFLFAPAWTGETGVAEDIKFGFDVPAGATFHFSGLGASTAGASAGTAVATDLETVARMSATDASTVMSFGASTGTLSALILLRITTTNAGNLQVMAAQNTSGVNDIFVVAGSYISGKRLT
jgi:hypothetical protein